MRIPEGLRWKATGRTVGEGGQGTVLEVVDRSEPEGTKYALKTLKRGGSSQAYIRFEREVRAIQSLNHPGIVKTVDWSLEPAFPHIVMELVEGATSLKKLLETNRSPFHGRGLSAARFFGQLVDVIAGCESVNVVHRDLSPANVLVLPNGQARVIDFGLCQIEGAAPVTLIDEGVGTQNYMAPECEAGSDGAITSSADLYSAGKLLWSAVTGSFAFAREAPAFRAKSMKALFPQHPLLWHLQWIFFRTIRHTPTNRWNNAADARAGLSRIDHLLMTGYPPLDLLSSRFCPVCGFGELKAFPGSHMVFGNPGLRGIDALQCTLCGFCVPVNTTRLRTSIQELEHAE